MIKNRIGQGQGATPQFSEACLAKSNTPLHVHNVYSFSLDSKGRLTYFFKKLEGGHTHILKIVKEVYPLDFLGLI